MKGGGRTVWQNKTMSGRGEGQSTGKGKFHTGSLVDYFFSL